MTTRHLLQLSLCFAVASCCSAIRAEEQAARKEVSVDVKQRLLDEVSKLEEMDKQWQQNKDVKSEIKVEPKTKEEKEAFKARKKAAESAEKEAKNRQKEMDELEKGKSKNGGESSGSGARVERSGNGGYVEAGGVSSSNRSSSSSYGSHSNSSSSSNSSVGVRATVIRLE
jgi:hypothetical protein